MEEKGILAGVVKEGLSKGTTSERPREANKTKWFLGESIPGRGGACAKALGAGVSLVCLGNSKKDSVAAVE